MGEFPSSKVTALFVGHRPGAIRNVKFLICCMTSYDYVLRSSCGIITSHYPAKFVAEEEILRVGASHLNSPGVNPMSVFVEIT